MQKVAEDRHEWAGYPMPLDDLDLIIEPRYPYAAKLAATVRERAAARPIDAEIELSLKDVTIRNTFWSSHKRADITIFQYPSGKIDWGLRSGMHSAGILISTIGAADAWGIEQEHNAIQTLGGMLQHRQFKQYLLTGAFIERSRRSGLSYVFRRLRPTLAISSRNKNGKIMEKESPRIIAALCMHPIGFYSGSWAGAMCPTDDVVAHLALMRGDERLFWKRCNQHPSWRKEAGI